MINQFDINVKLIFNHKNANVAKNYKILDVNMEAHNNSILQLIKVDTNKLEY